MRRFLTLLGVAAWAWACSSAEESTVSEEPILYEASELALVMRKMAAGHEEYKEKFTAGEWDASVLQQWKQQHSKMQSAQPTDPGAIGEEFKVMSAAYVEHMEQVIALVENKASQKEKLEAYNALIETCIGCHQVHCQGPIPRIKKMKLSVDPGGVTP